MPKRVAVPSPRFLCWTLSASSLCTLFVKMQASNYIYLYRSLGRLLYVFHREFYIQSYFNQCQYWTLPLTLLKIYNSFFLIKQFDHIIKMNVQTLRLLQILWSHIIRSEIYKLLHIEVFKRYLVRKANSHPFLGVDI